VITAKGKIMKLATRTGVALAFASVMAMGAAPAVSAADFSGVVSCIGGGGVYKCSDKHGNTWYTDNPSWRPYSAQQ
jgi:hypothetical protein